VAATAEEIRGYDAKEGYQYVVLGEYPQDADGAVRPILWRVLSVEDGEAFLFSEYILINGCVHPDDKEYVAFGQVWNKTFRFAWLNGEFANEAFTEAERARLADDEDLGAVFLVSSEDLSNETFGFKKGAGGNKARQGYGTPYALASGLFKYGPKGNHSSPYWTRTASVNKETSGATRCTKQEGTVGYIRCVVEDEGVRPAIRLILGDEPFAGGEGTLGHPFYYGQ